METQTKISSTTILQIISVCGLALLIKKHCEQENMFHKQQYTFGTMVMYAYLTGICTSILGWILQNDYLGYTSDIILSGTIMSVCIEVLSILLSHSKISETVQKKDTTIISNLFFYLIVVALWSYNIYLLGRILVGYSISKLPYFSDFSQKLSSIDSSYTNYPEDWRDDIKSTLGFEGTNNAPKIIEYAVIIILLGGRTRYMRESSITHYILVGLGILVTLVKRFFQRKQLPPVPYIHETINLFF